MSFEEKIERMRERQEALAESVELILRAVQEDGENIRALARIAEIHEHRLTRLEGEA